MIDEKKKYVRHSSGALINNDKEAFNTRKVLKNKDKRLNELETQVNELAQLVKQIISKDQ